jgi:hypothetical protein
MKKRFAIWIAVAIAGVGVFVALQRIKKTEMEQEGRVTYHKKSGDLIQFLTRELQQYGGTVTTTGSVPVMRAEWRYAEDTNGFQILIAQSHRAELVRSFTSALGEPTLRDQYPHLVYKEDRLGVGIVANLQSDPIHIICLRRGALSR